MRHGTNCGCPDCENFHPDRFNNVGDPVPAKGEATPPKCFRCGRPCIQGHLGSWMCDCTSTPFDCRVPAPSVASPGTPQRKLLNTLRDVASGHYSPEEAAKLITPIAKKEVMLNDTTTKITPDGAGDASAQTRAEVAEVERLKGALTLGCDVIAGLANHLTPDQLRAYKIMHDALVGTVQDTSESMIVRRMRHWRERAEESELEVERLKGELAHAQEKWYEFKEAAYRLENTIRILRTEARAEAERSEASEKAMRAELRDRDEDDADFIECVKCGASTNLQYSLKDDGRPDLVARWNKRAAIQLPDAQQAKGSSVASKLGWSREDHDKENADNEPPICKKCGDEFTVEYGYEVTDYCDPCAQEIAADAQSEVERLKGELAHFAKQNLEWANCATQHRLRAERSEASEKALQVELDKADKDIEIWRNTFQSLSVVTRELRASEKAMRDALAPVIRELLKGNWVAYSSADFEHAECISTATANLAGYEHVTYDFEGRLTRTEAEAALASAKADRTER
jgi:hypothetical protein